MVRIPNGPFLPDVHQADAARALARGKVWLGQVAGFPPVYASTEDAAVALATRKARAAFRRARHSGAPGPARAYQIVTEGGAA